LSNIPKLTAALSVGRTPCKYGRKSIAFRVNEGSTNFWLSLLVEFEDGAGDIGSMQIKQVTNNESFPFLATPPFSIFRPFIGTLLVVGPFPSSFPCLAAHPHRAVSAKEEVISCPFQQNQLLVQARVISLVEWDRTESFAGRVCKCTTEPAQRMCALVVEFIYVNFLARRDTSHML
jgi:hypothetical protein